MLNFGDRVTVPYHNCPSSYGIIVGIRETSKGNLLYEVDFPIMYQWFYGSSIKDWFRADELSKMGEY